MNKTGIQLKKIIYPATLVIIIAAITASAILTIRFLTTNINASFDINESALEAGAIRVNIESYKLAAKKLSIEYPASLDSSTLPPIQTEEQ